MNGSTPFSDDALERSIREYYQRREAPVAPFERSWAALKTALEAEPGAGRAPDQFNVAVDAIDDDEVAFILEDTLDDAMEDTMPGDENTRPTTTVPSPRMDTRRRGLSPRAMAIAAVAAALLLVIIAATIFTQLAVRRTPHPAATATPSAYTRITLPKTSQRTISALASAPDGSLWFADSIGHNGGLGRVAPDGSKEQGPLNVSM